MDQSPAELLLSLESPPRDIGTVAVREHGDPIGGAYVGRERELSELAAALDGLDSGRGTLFLVSGEPAIGKTRLADELAAGAAARGVSVAWGAAWDGGGAPLLWPWIQVPRAGLPAASERC